MAVRPQVIHDEAVENKRWHRLDSSCIESFIKVRSPNYAGRHSIPLHMVRQFNCLFLRLTSLTQIKARGQLTISSALVLPVKDSQNKFHSKKTISLIGDCHFDVFRQMVILLSWLWGIFFRCVSHNIALISWSLF